MKASGLNYSLSFFSLKLFFLAITFSGGTFLLNACRSDSADSLSNSNDLIPSANFNLNKNLSTQESPSKTDKSVKKDSKLQAESDALLHLFDNMPSVPVYLKDVPILPRGSNVERGVAYTDCEEKKYPTIYIKKSFYDKKNRKQLINILKHELTHAWLCRQGVMSGHDARFQQKFKEVGGFGN